MRFHFTGFNEMTDTTAPKKRGRPKTKPPKAQVDAICHWISEGGTLRSYCRQPNTPFFTTVYGWLDKDPDFAVRFARARDIGHDSIAQECFDIADETPPLDHTGRTDSGFVSWQKNRIWTRTQLLAKWDRKKYGDGNAQEQEQQTTGSIQKVQIEVIGKDAN